MLVAALNEALMTASRSDWLHFALARVRDRLRGNALDFLFEDPYSHRPDTDESTFLLAAIAPADLPAAIALADAWCTSICAELEILATARERDVQFVREQLASTEHTAGFKSVSEDGDDAAYLLGFLRSLRDDMARALAADETTIRVRMG